MAFRTGPLHTLPEFIMGFLSQILQKVAAVPAPASGVAPAGPVIVPSAEEPHNGNDLDPFGEGDHWKRVFEFAPDALYLSDLAGTFLDGNREAERMLGYLKEELIGKNISKLDLLPSDQWAKAASLLARNALGKATGPDEFVLRRKDGGLVRAELRTFPTQIDGRTIVLGIARDISRRKKPEEDSAAWKKRYELIITASGQVVYNYNVDTGEVDWSGSLEAVLGYEREEMGGIKEWADRIHPEGREEALRLLDVAEKSSSVYDVDYRFRHKDQSYLWIHDRGMFLFDEDKKSRRMIGLMQDITQRKQAEILHNAVYRIADAADSSLGLASLYKAVHEIIGTVMPAGNFYIALYDRENELIRFPYFVDEVDAPPAPLRPGKGLTEYVIRTGKPLLCDEATDLELRRAGKVEIIGAPSAIWLGVPLRVDNAVVGAMVVQHYSDPKAYGHAELRMLEFVSSQVAKSIEHKRYEEALRESQERLSLHVQQTPLAVVEWDSEFRVLRWNDAARQIFGYTAAEAIGKHASFIVPERFMAHVDGVWADLMAKRGGRRSTNENITKDGRTIFCEWYNTPLVGADGNAIGAASLAQDVTERKRAEESMTQGLAQLRRTLKAAIDSLASAIELRDPYTAGHQERVTRLAVAIAAEMKLDPERIEGIQIAGVIHDIGKLYVPAEILSKPTKLSELEYAMIRMHSQVGYTILGKIDFPWPIADIVHQHHEAINGSGYPHGLKGKDILIEARILSVADVVEAMSSHRPYRAALGLQAAFDEITQKRGILYDREVVDACLRLFREKGFKLA
jgi:PAS domain S-box-containing protein/putative nucleotidyltransferase with HDIG domain